MGKPTGFKEYDRKNLNRELADTRVQHFGEFEHSFKEKEAELQGARCMDCGVPFCHGPMGCPVVNFIPEWNDLIYRKRWKEALDNLHSTNNFPEFTGRLCPAPCEGACVLGINEPPVSIKAIERAIIDKGFEEGWIKPIPPKELTGKSIAIIGSGPAGLTSAQELCRLGHTVTVYEKNDRIGGLLRYGIPDFKMEKHHIDRRIKQMQAEGVKFKTNIHIGQNIHIQEIQKKYDVVVLACGAEKPRGLPIPGHDLKGVHFAMEFLTQQNKQNAGDDVQDQILATGKNVIVIGGGDTGSDCIGTSSRQKAKSIHQFEIFPQPTKSRSSNNPWPYWPLILRTSSSHEEGVERVWSINTKEFVDDGQGRVSGLKTNQVEFKKGKFIDIPESNREFKAELILLAMGFSHPEHNGMIQQLKEDGLKLNEKGNIETVYENNENSYKTNLLNLFACGDMRRGQSLIVWAIAEGRQCAASVNQFLLQEAIV